MAKRKKSTAARSRAATEGGTAGLAAAPPTDPPRDGTVTLLRILWRATSPNFAIVPPLGCGETLAQMLFIDGENAVPNESVPDLRDTLEAMTVHLPPSDFAGAVAAIGAALVAFNASNGTTYVVDSDCSLPNHVSNGAGGCRPGSGHTLLLKNGNPAKAKLSKNYYVGTMIVSHGLAVSIEYPPTP